MRRVNLSASLIIFVLVGVTLGWLVPNYVPSAHDAGDLPPTLVPILSMAVCALMALLLGISAWRQRGDIVDETQDDEAAEQLNFGLSEAANLLIWLAASAVIWLLLKYVGFVVAAAVTIAAGTVYGGIRNIWLIISSALIIPLLVDKIVWYGLNIRLP
jgi:F0F1-type ATP synthase assembly protein I